MQTTRYSVMDKYIIKFCEDMKLPILDDEEHIKQIENTLFFQRYKLAMLIEELWEEIKNALQERRIYDI